MTVSTAGTRNVRVTEGYWRYRPEFADSVTARTDTPDLMRIFHGASGSDDELLAEGYREMADDDHEFADSALAAGAEALPAE